MRGAMMNRGCPRRARAGRFVCRWGTKGEAWELLKIVVWEVGTR